MSDMMTASRWMMACGAALLLSLFVLAPSEAQRSGEPTPAQAERFYAQILDDYRNKKGYYRIEEARLAFTASRFAQIEANPCDIDDEALRRLASEWNAVYDGLNLNAPASFGRDHSRLFERMKKHKSQKCMDAGFIKRGLAEVVALQEEQKRKTGVYEVEEAMEAFLAPRLHYIDMRPCDFDDASLAALAGEWPAYRDRELASDIARRQSGDARGALSAYQRARCFESRQANPETRVTISEFDALVYVLVTSDCRSLNLREVIPTLAEVADTIHPAQYNEFHRLRPLLADTPQDRCVVDVVKRALVAKSLADIAR